MPETTRKAEIENWELSTEKMEAALAEVRRANSNFVISSWRMGTKASSQPQDWWRSFSRAQPSATHHWILNLALIQFYVWHRVAAARGRGLCWTPLSREERIGVSRAGIPTKSAKTLARRRRRRRRCLGPWRWATTDCEHCTRGTQEEQEDEVEGRSLECCRAVVAGALSAPLLVGGCIWYACCVWPILEFAFRAYRARKNLVNKFMTWFLFHLIGKPYNTNYLKPR